MAKLSHFAIEITVFLLLVVGAEKKLDAAEFRIREIVRTGQAAPGGGTFTRFEKAAANKKGEMFFAANTSSGEGLFVVEQRGTSLLLRTVVWTGYVPSAQKLGYQPAPCPVNDPEICAREHYIDSQGNYVTNAGICEPRGTWGTVANQPVVDGNRRPVITDSRDIMDFNGINFMNGVVGMTIGPNATFG